MANVRKSSQTAAIEAYLQFKLVVFVLKTFFPFLLVKANLNGGFLAKYVKQGEFLYALPFLFAVRLGDVQQNAGYSKGDIEAS